MTESEIIRAAAEKVMCWTAKGREIWTGGVWVDDFPHFPGCRIHSGAIDRVDGWNPLTSIADAFMLDSALAADGWRLCLRRRFDGWLATYARGVVEIAAGDKDPSRAITLAALNASGVEVA